jgi:uncharacterized protein
MVRTLGDWATVFENADIVLNLAGRTVNCRCNEENLKQMMDSRVDSTRVIGDAIAACKNPPRKVALRSAMTMSPDPGSVFDVFRSLARNGLLGTAGSGRQYVSWIHEEDFGRALEYLIDCEDLDGAVNLASPNALPNTEFCRIQRQAVGAKFGPPVPALFLEIGAIFMKTETELVLKSRRVIPTRLLNAGFEFRFPDWEAAARDLAGR